MVDDDAYGIIQPARNLMMELLRYRRRLMILHEHEQESHENSDDDYSESLDHDDYDEERYAHSTSGSAQEGAS
jgi:hypothetical protein